MQKGNNLIAIPDDPKTDYIDLFIDDWPNLIGTMLKTIGLLIFHVLLLISHVFVRIHVINVNRVLDY